MIAWSVFGNFFHIGVKWWRIDNIVIWYKTLILLALFVLFCIKFFWKKIFYRLRSCKIFVTVNWMLLIFFQSLGIVSGQMNCMRVCQTQVLPLIILTLWKVVFFLFSLWCLLLVNIIINGENWGRFIDCSVVTFLLWNIVLLKVCEMIDVIYGFVVIVCLV